MSRAAATPAGAEPTRRLTLSQIVERLLERGSGDHSSVTLTRNAKGETQIEVTVRASSDGAVVTTEDAEAVAQGVYDRLRERYPYGGAS